MKIPQRSFNKTEFWKKIKMKIRFAFFLLLECLCICVYTRTVKHVTVDSIFDEENHCDGVQTEKRWSQINDKQIHSNVRHFRIWSRPNRPYWKRIDIWQLLRFAIKKTSLLLRPSVKRKHYSKLFVYVYH